MKKSIVLSIIMVFVLTGCSESYLEQTNPNALVSENSWSSEKDINTGLTACYHTLYNSFYNCVNALLIGGQSDEFYSQSPDSRVVNFVNLTYPDYDQNWNVFGWEYLYQSVFRANQVIVNAENVKFTNEEDKKDIVAQARALRGMDYYYLTMLWKKVPIVDWISSPSDQAKEAAFEELVSFIESDLTYAAENLKESYSEVGRVNKYFAYCFLGKLYMNSGQWEKAKKAFAYVVNSGKYSLTIDYKDNFKHTTENNSESIFEIQNSDENQVINGFYGIANDGSPCSYSTYREKFLSPSPYGFGDYSVYDWLVEMYKDEKDKDGHYDVRLKDNIVYPGIFTDFPDEKVYLTKESWDSSNWGTYSWCRKYSTDYYRSSTTFYNPINTRILRYGEILLSYAESLVMADGASSITEATKYVDMVRERANLYKLLQSVHSDCLNSKDAFIARLRIEREKETCFEYDRFFDLRRWGLGTEETYTSEVKARCIKYNNNFKSGKEWLPIPQSEVDNNPNLTQNNNY